MLTGLSVSFKFFLFVGLGQVCLQLPELMMTHDPPEVFVRSGQGRRRPAQGHGPVLPVRDLVRLAPGVRKRRLDEVSACRTNSQIAVSSPALLVGTSWADKALGPSKTKQIYLAGPLRGKQSFEFRKCLQIICQDPADYILYLLESSEYLIFPPNILVAGGVVGSV